MATTTNPPVKPAKTPPVGPARPIRKLVPNAPQIVRFYRSSVGKKWVMAVTGVMLMGFVVVHLIGNLKLYLSKEEINLYGEALRDMPGHLLPAHGAAVDDPDRADRRVRPAHPRRVLPHGHEPEGPPAAATSRRATTSPPTSRRARCAGPASSCCSTSCSTSWISRGATRTRSSCAAIRTTTSCTACSAPSSRSSTSVANIALGVPPLPRRLVDVPEPRHQQPAHQQAARGRSPPASRDHRARQHQLPDLGAGPRGRSCK